jgi:hypothetical protein
MNLPKQPTLSKKLREAIGDTPRHVIATKYGISPAALTLFISKRKTPKQERTRQALSNLLKDRS